MRQRGRKSSESLSVVPIIPGIEVPRPEPPNELTVEQAEVWKMTVGAMKPTWFGAETHPMLVQYCRHVTIANVLAKAIHSTSLKADLNRFCQLTSCFGRESSAIAMLATRMRLTPRSRADSRTDGRDPMAGRPRPWETV
jgi:hypothetical protein